MSLPSSSYLVAEIKGIHRRKTRKTSAYRKVATAAHWRLIMRALCFKTTARWKSCEEARKEFEYRAYDAKFTEWRAYSYNYELRIRFQIRGGLPTLLKGWLRLQVQEGKGMWEKLDFSAGGPHHVCYTFHGPKKKISNAQHTIPGWSTVEI